MGCGSSSETTDNTISKQEDDDDMADPKDIEINIKDVEEGYPLPKPPRNKKADIFRPEEYIHIDERARQTPLEMTNSWEELVSYLTNDCKTDLQKLRALFVWLGTLNFNDVPNNNVDDPDSLQNMIREVKMKRLSYAIFFTYLCRFAKLPCALIRGYGKSVAYEVGDSVYKVRELYNNWNAVYVDGDWRLVVPLWACKAVVGHSTGKYTLVESEGTAVRSVERATEGLEVSSLNEHYFLTDPEKLVVVLLARDPKWQLLKEPYTIEKFCKIPFLRQTYFQYNLAIKNEFNGCIYAKNGVSDSIVIAAQKESWEGVLTYSLYFNHEESKDKIPGDLQLDRYVIMGRQNSTWTFIVRFPVAGIYKMSIYGGPSQYITSWICDYKLVCHFAKEDIQPLPCDPGLIGFGPTKELESAGLSGPSQTSGIVIVKRNQQINFTFVMKRKVSIRTVLVHNTINENMLQQYVTQRAENKRLNVSVHVPQNSEYALRMYAKNKEANSENNVCNYLLTPDDPRRKKRTRENPTEKRTREYLNGIVETSNDPSEVEKAIERFNKMQLDDKGDLSKAIARKTFLQLQQDLRDAINRRHMETLEKAIKHSKLSEYANDLKSETERAENVLDHLRRLKGFSHDILELKQSTVSEIRSYNTVEPTTYDVMKATYILLGEKEDYIEDWESMKSVLGQLGKHSLITRIRNFDFLQLTAEIVQSAQEIIHKYNKETVQTVSAGVGTFYVWCKNICDEFNRTKS